MKYAAGLVALAATGVSALAHQQQSSQMPVAPAAPVAPVAPVVPVAPATAVAAGPVPMFTTDTMPAVSTTALCIMNLCTQYFLIFTALAVLRTLNQVYKGAYVGAERLCATACATVVYCPVLAVLFLGCRMRAIQLTQGETDKYGLPQVWVQEAMQVASWSVLAQVVLVLAMPVFTGEMDVATDQDGNVDLEKMSAKMNKTAMSVLTVLKYLTMISLYGGVGVVIYGIHTMEAPIAIWGPGGAPAVSPAVAATINLSSQFMMVYLAAAVVRSLIQFQGPQPTYLKLSGALQLAQFTVNFAPMLCVLFIGARMRALQMDPKHGAPQAWAQDCFFLCAYSVMFQTLMVILTPFVYPSVTCKKGDFEGDVVFQGLTGLGGQILSAFRWLAVVSLYGGFTAVMYSVFIIEAPVGPTPPLSPAMSCVMNLTTQYFTIYLVLFLAQTAKQFFQTGHKTALLAEQARGTVMYAPMLATLFIICRMRALQLTKSADGTIPMGAGPQRWAQDCMFLSTWAVLVQVVLVVVLGLMFDPTKDLQMDADGNALPPKGASPLATGLLNFLRYFSMVSMYGGACAVVYAIGVMTPETLPPYASPVPIGGDLNPGIEVPQPPNPPTAKFF